jgi:hypothetical protein
MTGWRLSRTEVRFAKAIACYLNLRNGLAVIKGQEACWGGKWVEADADPRILGDKMSFKVSKLSLVL